MSGQGSALGDAPRLGFGCGNLYGGPKRGRSRRALVEAFASGVRYFDTARLYGHGAAEGILGSFIAQRRDQVFIASKAGILPVRDTLTHRVAARTIRMLRAGTPLGSILEAPAPPEPVFGVFGVEQVRASIETSLKQLRTDHLDLLLLHECRPADVLEPGLMDLLGALVSQGKVRAWGIATDADSTLELLNQDLPGLGAVQIAHNVFEPMIERVRRVSPLPIIVHSVLGTALARMREALKSDSPARRRALELGVDPNDSAAIAQGLIAAALADNPGGVVLFSALDPIHIAQSANASKLSTTDIDRVREIARVCATST